MKYVDLLNDVVDTLQNLEGLDVEQKDVVDSCLLAVSNIMLINWYSPKNDLNIIYHFVDYATNAFTGENYVILLDMDTDKTFVVGIEEFYSAYEMIPISVVAEKINNA